MLQYWYRIAKSKTPICIMEGAGGSAVGITAASSEGSGGMGSGAGHGLKGGWGQELAVGYTRY